MIELITFMKVNLQFGYLERPQFILGATCGSTSFLSFIFLLVGWLVWWMFFAARSRHQGRLADHAWNHAQTHHSSHIPAHEAEANMLTATLGPIQNEHAIWTSGIPFLTSRRLLLLLLRHLACLCLSHVCCEIHEASVCLTGWMARPQSMRRHIPKYSFNDCNRHRGWKWSLLKAPQWQTSVLAIQLGSSKLGLSSRLELNEATVHTYQARPFSWIHEHIWIFMNWKAISKAPTLPTCLECADGQSSLNEEGCKWQASPSSSSSSFQLHLRHLHHHTCIAPCLKGQHLSA